MHDSTAMHSNTTIGGFDFFFQKVKKSSTLPISRSSNSFISFLHKYHGGYLWTYYTYEKKQTSHRQK